MLMFSIVTIRASKDANETEKSHFAVITENYLL